MKKQIVAVLTGCALSALLASTAFADEGWVMRGSDWYYLDSDGKEVTEEWKDNDAGTYKFYLGDSGKMYVNTLFDIDDTWYYVNEDGARIENNWRLLRDSENNERWYYFDGSGKAYKSGWKSINGKKYHFTDSVMDYGYLTADGDMIEEGSDRWKEAVYYVGDNDDGARKENKWLLVDDFDNEEYDFDELWVYFGNNGKKLTNRIQRIGSYRYMFDEQGAMLYDWQNNATDSNASKFYDTKSGAMKSGGWFQAVPSEEQDPVAWSDEEERWFYANKSGVTYKNGIKTINGKKYIFDENGIMRTGLLIVDDDKHIVDILSEDEEDFPDVATITSARKYGNLLMTDSRGVIKTGKVSVELDGVKYTMQFQNSGLAKHGEVSGYLYDNGIQIKINRDEYDYKYMPYTLDGKEYLVNTSGRIQKEGTYNDNDDVKWTVTKEGIIKE